MKRFLATVLILTLAGAHVAFAQPPGGPWTRVYGSAGQSSVPVTDAALESGLCPIPCPIIQNDGQNYASAALTGAGTLLTITAAQLVGMQAVYFDCGANCATTPVVQVDTSTDANCTTWISQGVSIYTVSGQGAFPSSTVTGASTGHYVSPVAGKCIRLTLNSLGGGTTTWQAVTKAGTIISGSVNVGQFGSAANLAVSIGGSPTSSLAITPAVGAISATTGLSLKGSSGNLYDFYAQDVTGGKVLYVFNATSAPADGAITAGTSANNYEECVVVPATGTSPVFFNSGTPERYSTGILLIAGTGTTCGASLTKTTASFGHGRVQ